MQTLLIFFSIRHDFSYFVQYHIDVIVLYEGAILPELGTRSGHACTSYMFRLIQISGHAIYLLISAQSGIVWVYSTPLTKLISISYDKSF